MQPVRGSVDYVVFLCRCCLLSLDDPISLLVKILTSYTEMILD